MHGDGTLSQHSTSSLTKVEEQWKQLSEFFETKGYTLRPRYRKDWYPSWELPHYREQPPDHMEDHIHLPAEWHSGIDATQLSTGRRVWIKRTTSYYLEGVLEAFNSSKHPWNHCVPMLDVFHEEGREDIRFIVMPFLRPAHEPPLQTVGDAVDFVSQILDGLAFLHSKQYLTKHGDILMDASSLFPHGFHPIKLDLDPTARFPVKRRARSEVHVKYYFTNPVAEYAQYPYHSGSLALPPELLEPTELSRRSYYKIDIWYVGQVLKTQLLDVYSNIDFLQWTVGIMTDREPDFRLPAVDCREMWQGSIPRDLTTVGLARRLRFRQETWLQSMALDVIAMLGAAARFVEKFLVWLNNMHVSYMCSRAQ